MNKEQQIEEMANYYCEYCKNQTGEKFCEHIDDKSCNIFFEAELFYNAGYRKLPKDSVVLSREEYEKLKSLYDTQKGAIMTSKIGDIPLTIAGLRKAVDEIGRLKAENEKLLDSVESVQAGRCRLRCELTKKAVKEFAEKLKEKARKGASNDAITYKFIERDYTITESELNELLKEYEHDN